MSRPSSTPIGNLRTEVSLPVFPLSHRCSVCKIYHQQPELFDELSRRLLAAQPYQQILAWLAEHEIQLKPKHLSLHNQRHIQPYVRDVLEYERRLRIEVRTLEEIQGMNLAAAFARKLAADGLTALRSLNLAAQLSRINDPAMASELLGQFTRLIKALADIDRAGAEIELKRQLVELRKLEVMQKTGRLDEIAIRILESALKEHPALAQQVRAALATSCHPERLATRRGELCEGPIPAEPTGGKANTSNLTSLPKLTKRATKPKATTPDRRRSRPRR